MTINSHQRKMRSRTWGASFGGCSCAPIPADQFQFHDATSQASNCRGFGLGFLIPIARLGILSPAEHRRAGLRDDLPLHGRPVTEIVRAVMAARRQQILRIELEPAKQSADPFHVEHLSSSVSQSRTDRSDGAITGAQEPFAFGAKDE